MSDFASDDPGLTSPQTLAEPSTLAELRVELDRLDDALHDLLMARAEVVARVAACKNGGAAPGRSALRPGREAAILRRLLARHHGNLAAQNLVRIWREMLAASTAMQGPATIAVAEPAGASAGEDMVALAREHFGALTPLHVYRSAAQAIGDLGAGRTSAAVLPMPAEGEAAPWWPGLLHRAEPRLYVVARLPFWVPRPEGAPRGQALVLATPPPDPSGADHTLLGVELPPGLSRTGAADRLAAAGFPGARMQVWRPASGPVALALLDVEDFVAEDDPRLAVLGEALRPPMVLGAYATPVDGDVP